jgi:hypothetical protein
MSEPEDGLAKAGTTRRGDAGIDVHEPAKLPLGTMGDDRGQMATPPPGAT